MTEEAGGKGYRWVSLVLLGLIGLGYSAWILWLPLFPTQDGPMHLYYARIMQALLFHRDPGIYPQYFVIKHVLPPYALYYYLLLGFGHFVTLVVADKLVICGYLYLFLFGFRYLARGLGEQGDAMALLISPIVMNWPLCMGFVNFCLSTALACWTLGLWVRLARDPQAVGNGWRRVGFVALCGVVMLTHPVPLVLVLGFCAAELGLRWVMKRGDLLKDGLALGLAGCTMLYVKAFTTSHVTKQFDARHPTFVRLLKNGSKSLAKLNKVDMLALHDWGSVLRRGLLYALLVVAVGLGWMQLRRTWNSRVRTSGAWTTPSWTSHSWSVAELMLGLGVLVGILIPLLPPDFNSSHFFAARLTIFMVIALVAGGSGAMLQPAVRARLMWGAAVGAVVMFGVTLYEMNRTIAPVARELARMEVTPAGERQGVYLSLLDADYERQQPTNGFDPYYWAGSRVIRRTDSVMWNIPWLDLAIIPVGAKPGMLGTDAGGGMSDAGKMDADALETSGILRAHVMASDGLLAAVLGRVDAVVIERGLIPEKSGMDGLLTTQPGRWVCGDEEKATVCRVGK